MEKRTFLHGTVFSIICLGLIFMFGTSTASPAGPSAASAVRTAKCTVDIADGKETDCALIKANDEWILWMNSSSTPRSIHFKSDENPFSEKSCWDVAPGARARSGPVALSAKAKAYVAHASVLPCGSNFPAADSGVFTVTVQ
jgi:hypothetical protein